MSTIPILLVVAVVVLVIIPIATALYRSWKVPRAWNALRDNRDLEDESDEQQEDPTRLAGEIQEMDVEVWMDSDIAAGGQSGPPHKQYTNIEVPLSASDDSRIGVQKRGIGTAIVRLVMTGPGGFDYKSDEVSEDGDPELEDDAFDDRFDVAGDLSDALRDALQSPEVRSKLEEVLTPSSELHVEEGTLRYTEPGRVSGRTRLKQLVDALVETALALDTALADGTDEVDDPDEDGESGPDEEARNTEDESLDRPHRETPADISA